MALDVTTAKQQGISYETAYLLSVPGGLARTEFPRQMKAFKLQPNSATAIRLYFQSGTYIDFSIDATLDDGKVIPFRPEAVAAAAAIDIECLF